MTLKIEEGIVGRSQLCSKPERMRRRGGALKGS